MYMELSEKMEKLLSHFNYYCMEGVSNICKKLHNWIEEK